MLPDPERAAQITWGGGFLASNCSYDLPLRITGANGEYRFAWKSYTGSMGTPPYAYQVKTRRLVNSADAWTFPEAETLF